MTQAVHVVAELGPGQPAPPVRVFGVRHHGPGSARALVRALDAYAPDCVLVEGPADADDLIEWVADEQLVPPVAILAWRADEPLASVFWPFAILSPEWQALRWAAGHGVEAHFMDLPAASLLGAREDATPAQVAPVRVDAIGQLAEIAGYDDPEAWWEDGIELRSSGDPFEPLNEAFAMLREANPEEDDETLRREAHMRKVLRAAARRGHERIAVVCGAWHAPALAGKLPPASADNALLTGLPKARTELTWVPWTHQRLAQATGYGAGVRAPGWYHHLFTSDDQPIVRWLTKVAGVLRANDLPVSSAHIIEATRLAETLATMRGRPMPGLSEVTEATWSVLCDGSDLVADLVTREVVVGQALGEVPDAVPMVPLDADLRATAKRLRLQISAVQKDIVLDLRKPNDLAKSHLLRRVAILGIEWGTLLDATSTGTFKEAWGLVWQPEFAVRIVEAAKFGNTVESAAGNALLADLTNLAVVTTALEAALAADLGDVLPILLRTLDERAAGEPDVTRLLDSIPPSARAQRYGDVRGTDTAALGGMTAAILARACAGLPAACSGVADDLAGELQRAIDGVQEVIGLLGAEFVDDWHGALLATLAVHALPGLLAGRLTRLLLDAGVFDSTQAGDRLSRALSSGADPAWQAGWVEGFLAGSALLLIHDDLLLGIIDAWARGIAARTFVDVLPALRRGFGAWSPAERRALAARVRALGAAPATTSQPTEFDWDFVQPVLASVSALLGGAR